MEFVQYHPTGLPFTGILITEAARAEGGYMLNKDGYRYLQDYNLGKPQPEPVLRSMELGPRDRLSQAFVKEYEKGRTIEGPYGAVVHLDLRHLGEKKINAKLPFVRELCLKYENLDPVKELIPVRPVIHYMMGGIHTDMNGATPLKGLYAAGEAACVSINGANRLGSNSLDRVSGLWSQGRTGRGRVRIGAKNAGPASAGAGGRRRGAPGGPVPEQDRRARAHRHHPGRDAEDHGAERRNLPLRRIAAARQLTSCASCRSGFEDVGLDDHSRTFNTELVAALELASMLDVAESMIQCALHRTESRGAHQRTDFPARDDQKFLAHSLVCRQADGAPGGELSAGDHHSLAARGTSLRKIIPYMAEQIALEVTRFSPERDKTPSVQSFDVPLRKEWVVLDALNYIKDKVDGSLSFRWSCRMGVCGSCGMMVNGEPKLTCATFLTDYAPGPVRVEPLKNFPVMRDLIVEITDFLEKLSKVKPWIIRDKEKPVSEGEYLQTPEQLDTLPAVQHVHQLPAVLRGLPGLWAGPAVRRPGGAGAGATLQHGFARRRQERTARHSLAARWNLGLHVRRRVHRGLSQARGSGRRNSAIQTDRDAGMGQIAADALGR